ncbi:MAG TPA: alpha-2-macroglobulin family protein, partial [Puia sp.]|nr:alpha-2-macroglobulin family protein [Puia sp.]
IGFIAKPDPKVDRKANPSFTYRIEADITDLNGETRSGSTSLSLSYRSFEIDCDLPSESRIPADSLQTISVTTRNANGEFTSQRLSATLYKLKSPERLIRKRYWDQPDQFVMTEAEFLRSFPLDEYRNETDKTSWPRESRVGAFSDSTQEDGHFFSSRKAMNLSPGWYELEFSARDVDGQLITDKRFIELTGSSNKPDYTGYNLIESENESAEPGDRVSLTTATAAGHVFVIRARQGLSDTLPQYSFYGLNREIGSTIIPVEEKDRGGFEVTDVFVKDNRWYTSSHLVRVPWTNKQLHIVYETWRDKLLPGSRETWSVKITGQQKDPVAAELLTAMYDASLDQFSPHQWELPEIYPGYEADSWDGEINFSAKSSFDHNAETGTNDGFYNRYDQIGNSVYRELAGSAHGLVIRGLAAPNMMYAEEDKDMPMKKSVSVEVKFSSPKIAKDEAMADSVAVSEKPQSNPNEIQIRKNFNETAFFFPELKTDSSGNVEFSFTMPEALTRWKWMTFASTKDLAFGYSEKSVVTQKELMLQPNMPRFFREGDTLSIPVKIANLSKANQQGTVVLDWLSADESSKLNEKLGNRAGIQSFQVPAGQSTVVFFPLIIPAGFHEPVVYQVKASTPAASDGEQNMVPVLSNRLLVTESFPMNMREQTERSFSWEKLLNSGKSNTLQNQSLTVEYSTNPAWYVVQALPYLIEFPYECAEQTFNRLYADALATQIMNSAPALRQVIESWNGEDSAALLSNLQKNQDLKIALLRETPWVLEAQNENEQKKNLAHLLDLTVMSRQVRSALDKLKQMQTDGGGFPWFTGGRDDRYITQYIATGIGRLRKLRAIPKPQEADLDRILRSSVSFLDAQLVTDYQKRPKKEDEEISPIQIQYLYMRSFFPELPVAAKTNTAIAYYRKKILAQWVKQNMYLRGMAALYFYRTGAKSTAADLLRSLQENATRSEALGMYWKSVQPGYYWQESPVETQSLLIEAFQEMGQPTALIDDMKYWLLQQKHTTHWSSTKATADACYAVLMTGGNWLASGQTVNIQLGGKINISGEPGEAGTGYFRKTVPGQQVQPAMGNIHIEVQPESGNKPVPSSGALYWQYFENLDRITAGQSALLMEKALYLEKETKNGTVWEPVDATSRLKPGDKLKVRIIIKTDRDLEYVQLKDMRAACLEPVNVLSGYHWQGGLGYYESTSDESTSFFFDWLPKGTNVFEYPLLVTTAGAYSNGISSLQCMYAPEFAAHTGGIRLTVTGK